MVRVRACVKVMVRYVVWIKDRYIVESGAIILEVTGIDMINRLNNLMANGDLEVAMDLCEEQGWSFPRAILVPLSWTWTRSGSRSGSLLDSSLVSWSGVGPSLAGKWSWMTSGTRSRSGSELVSGFLYDSAWTTPSSWTE